MRTYLGSLWNYYYFRYYNRATKLTAAGNKRIITYFNSTFTFSNITKAYTEPIAHIWMSHKVFDGLSCSLLLFFALQLKTFISVLHDKIWSNAPELILILCTCDFIPFTVQFFFNIIFWVCWKCVADYFKPIDFYLIIKECRKLENKFRKIAFEFSRRKNQSIFP